MELVTYKCPNCMGAVVFDSKSQQFKCEFCDSVFTLEQLKRYEDELLKAQQQPKESEYDWKLSENGELSGMTAYSCEFCGAQIVTDENTAASECPYCNNPIVMKQNLTGINRPDCVIPFTIGKEEAVEALKKFYKGKRLLPGEFVKGNRVKEIKGLYVPFWLFDCVADADIVYEATLVRIREDSRYIYTTTSYYDVRRAGTVGYERIPADASSKMSDTYMDAIEPFDYSKMTDFSAAYLSGYMADKYDVSVEDNIGRINERVENTTCEVFRKTVTGFNTVSKKNASVIVKDGSVRYALLPVWMLNTKYKDKTYTFAMNGQTGKLVGELPVDKGKAVKYFAGITAACFALGQIALLLLGLLG